MKKNNNNLNQNLTNITNTSNIRKPKPCIFLTPEQCDILKKSIPFFIFLKKLLYFTGKIVLGLAFMVFINYIFKSYIFNFFSNFTIFLIVFNVFFF